MPLRAPGNLWIAAWLAVALPAAQSQVPQAITYQGSLSSGGNPYSGAGLFKFALVNSNGAATFWSNDGSSVGGGQPSQAITNPVTRGLFTVLLGDTNMQPVSWTVFTNSDVRLRIWFNDGTNGFAWLSPDQRLTSSGFAMMAASVPNGAVTGNNLAAGAVSTANIAAGAVTSAQLAVNAVTTPALANGSVTAAKLAPQAVTSPALAEGAVTTANLALASVTTSAIANGAITAANLASNAVTASAIADGAISQSKLNFQLGFINARNPPFGAMGDGTNDDTTAIQSALNNVATNGGGIVFLPQGNYLINSSLVVPAQTSLVGVWRAPTAYSQYLGTTLLAVAGAGATNGNPFITLQGNNSTLEGVTIYYPNQVANNPPTPYPWAVSGGGGDNVTIQNVSLVNPYLGIDLATHTSARHLVRGVYGQPLLVGIAVDQCYDIGRIMETHFWPFWTQNTNVEAFQSANAVTFDFMRTDWEVVQDVFSWGYSIGARFRASTNGSMNGQMSNVNFDNVDVGLQLSATQPYAIHISNLNVANAGGGTNHIGIQGLAGSAGLNVNGATFWGSLYQPVSWANSGLLTLSNARFLSWSSSLPCIHISSGRAILQNNYFTDNIGVAISVSPTTQRVMVLGNMLCGNTVSLNAATTTSANNQP
ncbi:MAG: glycosyl hydrolase family 28-related protein [Limisphaerales bacterium]